MKRHVVVEKMEYPDTTQLSKHTPTNETPTHRVRFSHWPGQGHGFHAIKMTYEELIDLAKQIAKHI